MTNQELKKRIMRRVYTNWFIRKTKPVVFLQLPLAVVFVAVSQAFVSYRAVAQNAWSTLDSSNSFLEYLLSAFRSTEPLAVFLAAAALIFVVLAGRSIVRNFSALSNRKVILPLKVEK